MGRYFPFSLFMWQLYLNLLLGTAVVADVLFRTFFLLLFFSIPSKFFSWRDVYESPDLFSNANKLPFVSNLPTVTPLTKHLPRAQSSASVCGGFHVSWGPFITSTNSVHWQLSKAGFQQRGRSPVKRLGLLFSFSVPVKILVAPWVTA